MSNVHSLDKLKKDAEDPSKKKEYVGNGTNVEGPPRAVLESQVRSSPHPPLPSPPARALPLTPPPLAPPAGGAKEALGGS